MTFFAFYGKAYVLVRWIIGGSIIFQVAGFTFYAQIDILFGGMTSLTIHLGMWSYEWKSGTGMP